MFLWQVPDLRGLVSQLDTACTLLVVQSVSRRCVVQFVDTVEVEAPSLSKSTSKLEHRPRSLDVDVDFRRDRRESGHLIDRSS